MPGRSTADATGVGRDLGHGLAAGDATRQHGRIERQLPLQAQRVRGLLGGEIRQGNLRDVRLFAAQAGPEGRVDHRLDGGGVRNRWQLRVISGHGVEMIGEMRVNPRRHSPRHGVGALAHHPIMTGEYPFPIRS